MSRSKGVIHQKPKAHKPEHCNFIETTHEWAEGDDPTKDLARFTALRALRPFYLDQKWVHVIEAIEAYERVNPSLPPTVLGLLRRMKKVLPKTKGGKGGQSPAAYRNVAIIEYAADLQIRHGRLMPSGELNDLSPEEVDLLVQRFATTGVEKPIEGGSHLMNEHVRAWQCHKHPTMRRLISKVISAYRQLPAPHIGIRKIRR